MLYWNSWGGRNEKIFKINDNITLLLANDDCKEYVVGKVSDAITFTALTY